MDSLKSKNRNKIIFILLFLVLNIVNGFLVTTPFYNRNLNPYERDLFMVLNYILGDLGIMMILFSIGLFLFKKDISLFRYLVVITTVISVICIGMMLFSYNYLGMLFSFGNLKALNNPAGKEAFEFVLVVIGHLLKNAQFFSLLPIVFLSVFLIMYIKKDKESLGVSLFGKTKSRLYFASSFLIIGILLMSNATSSYKSKIEETWYEENRNVLYGVQSIGTYNYYFYDFYTYYFTNKYELNEEKVKNIQDKLTEYQNSNRISKIDNNVYGNNTDYTGIYEDKNLILIQAESLSNYVIGLKVNGIEITPNINKLLNKSIYFDNFYTAVGIGNTSDAEFSVMTGLYPTGDEVSVFTYNKGEYETLAKDFKNKGYTSSSLHGNTNIFYSRNINHIDIFGFDKFYGKEDLNHSSPLVHNWISDEEILKLTVDKMLSTPNKDFLYTLLVSCHTPYMDDAHIEEVLSDNEFNIDNYINDEMLLGYLKHSYYVDYSIGKFIEYLESTSEAKDTIIAIYGDHGGGISQDAIINNINNLTNDINPIDPNILNFYDLISPYAFRITSQEVPFIIYNANGEEDAKTISKVRGQTDIYRTISNLFNLDSKYYFGVDGLSDEPSLVYNPRNLDTFIDDFVLFVPPKFAYTPSLDIISYEIVEHYIDIVKYEKDLNDKILKYINSRN